MPGTGTKQYHSSYYVAFVHLRYWNEAGIQAGSSISPQICIRSTSTPFFGYIPWNLAHVFYEPLPARYQSWPIFRQIRLFIPGIFYVWVMGYPKILAKKNGESPVCQRLDRETTRMYLQKTAWTFEILNFVRKTCHKLLGLTSYLILALHTSKYAVRRSNICVKLLTDMPWSACNRLVRSQKMGKSLFFYTETPDHCWPCWRPVVGGDPFSPLLIAPVAGPEEKKWL